MHRALEQVYGDGDIDVRDYLFTAFMQVQGQAEYPAWLFGWVAFDGFCNYLHLLPREDREAVAEELEQKLEAFTQACAEGELSEPILAEVRTAFTMRRDESPQWRLLF
jgi:hypothetical protein